MSDKPTQKALKECAEAMVQMLAIGWPKSSLDELERIWWSVRDNHGKVKPATRASEAESGALLAPEVPQSLCKRIDHGHTPEKGCFELLPESERIKEMEDNWPSHISHKSATYLQPVAPSITGEEPIFTKNPSQPLGIELSHWLCPGTPSLNLGVTCHGCGAILTECANKIVVYDGWKCLSCGATIQPSAEGK